MVGFTFALLFIIELVFAIDALTYDDAFAYDDVFAYDDAFAYDDEFTYDDVELLAGMLPPTDICELRIWLSIGVGGVAIPAVLIGPLGGIFCCCTFPVLLLGRGLRINSLAAFTAPPLLRDVESEADPFC